MSEPAPFRGVIPPLVTPLDIGEEIDEVNLAQLVDHVITAGAAGVFVLGTTGEGACLKNPQRMRVIDTAVVAADGRVPVLAGTPDMGSDRIAEHARAAVLAGADMVVATAPLYGQPSTGEIAEHFVRVAEHAEIPIMAYDNPDVVGSQLDPQMIGMLAHEGVVCGLKDSSGDLVALRKVRSYTADIDGFALFTGSETLADVALWLGANGVVPGLGNVDIEGYVRLYRLVREGDWDAAHAEQERLIQLSQIRSAIDDRRVGKRIAAIGAVKEAMRMRGLLGWSATYPPEMRYESTELSQIHQILTDAELSTFTQ